MTTMTRALSVDALAYVDSARKLELMAFDLAQRSVVPQAVDEAQGKGREHLEEMDPRDRGRMTAR